VRPMCLHQCCVLCSTVHCVLCAACYARCAVCCVLCAVCCVLCAVCCAAPHLQCVQVVSHCLQDRRILLHLTLSYSTRKGVVPATPNTHSSTQVRGMSN
jgi:hypothetical protein